MSILCSGVFPDIVVRSENSRLPTVQSKMYVENPGTVKSPLSLSSTRWASIPVRHALGVADHVFRPRSCSDRHTAVNV